MKLLPEGIDELNSNLQWTVATRLQILEYVCRDLRPRKLGSRSKRETEVRLRRAVARRDRKAEEAALADYMWFELGEWWVDAPEQRLFSDLYERTALRRENAGTPDRMRPPTHAEGVRVAKALLVDLPHPGPLDPDEEATTVARVLGGEGLVSYQIPSRARLREYIRESRTSHVYFDALSSVCEELDRRGEAITGPLATWRQDVVDGRLQRPDRPPVPRHRPANPAQLPYEMQIQFAVAVLEWLGAPPRGTLVSGCRIVAEATDIPEDTVERIWKKCTWRTPYLPVMKKYSWAIAIRQGLLHPN